MCVCVFVWCAHVCACLPVCVCAWMTKVDVGVTLHFIFGDRFSLNTEFTDRASVLSMQRSACLCCSSTGLQMCAVMHDSLVCARI